MPAMDISGLFLRLTNRWPKMKKNGENPLIHEKEGNHMTQYERALSGRLFDAHSEELIQMKRKAHLLCQKFNALPEDDPTRLPLLEEFIGELGEHYYMQGPIQFNYGRNTKIGHDFFANFNFTVLDDGPVTIGDHVMIGPNVSMRRS